MKTKYIKVNTYTVYFSNLLLALPNLAALTVINQVEGVETYRKQVSILFSNFTDVLIVLVNKLFLYSSNFLIIQIFMSKNNLPCQTSNSQVSYLQQCCIFKDVLQGMKKTLEEMFCFLIPANNFKQLCNNTSDGHDLITKNGYNLFEYYILLILKIETCQ